jgi:Galactose oxidase-like, Early set domain/Galactose oxidase, central domain
VHLRGHTAPVRGRTGPVRGRALRCGVTVLLAAALSTAAAAGSAASSGATSATAGRVPSAAVDPAAAANDPGLAHALTDAAYLPMRALEKRADPRAGLRPKTGSAATLAAEAAALGPEVSGQWGPVQSAPLVPVMTALLPNGKVIMWDSIGDLPTNYYTDQTSTRVAVWDPATGAFTRVDVQGSNIFCAGFVQLADGRLFVAGGTKDAALDGIRLTHIFNWQTMSWQPGPDMVGERWYPSVTALMDGEALIVAGGPAFGEIRTRDGSIGELPGITSPSSRLYPFTQSAPDGRVLHSGSDHLIRRLDWHGSGAMETAVDRDGHDRTYGSYATYAPGLTLVSGGGATPVGGVDVPYASTTIVDTRSGTLTTRAAASMTSPRRQHQMTLLPDGSVLATGGMSVTGNGLVDLDHAVYAAERWNPATNTWAQLASASTVREYHSTAILLPDGRVLTGGGGICEACLTVGYLRKDIEVFSPPYLFAPDGSPAQRPTVSSAPSQVTADTAFSVASPDAPNITKVALVRLGAATHSTDQGQRYIPLTFSHSSSTTLSVSGPANVAEAPPGYYMLFLIDSAGVPSVAKMVQVKLPVPGAHALGSPRSGGPAALLYSGLARTGRSQPIEQGTWRASRGSLGQVGDDAARSADIADGWTVRMCRDDASSDCVTLGPGVRTPLPQGFDSRVSSAVVRPLVPDSQAPTTPTGLTVTRSSAGLATLTWNASTDDQGPPLYAVYRSRLSSFVPSSATLIGTSASLTFRETTSTPLGYYFFRVVALDPTGNTSAPTAAVASLRR